MRIKQSESLKAPRVEWASLMKAKYPRKEDWWHTPVRDELLFGHEPEEQLHIIRKPSIGYRHDNL